MSKAYLKRLLVLIPPLLLLTLLIYANIPDRPLADNVRADKIVVEKGKRKLSLIKSGEVLKRTPIEIYP